MANLKSISIEALSTAREKVSLADSIDSAVKEFLASVGGELENYVVGGVAFDQGAYGRALVTVAWTPNKVKK